MDPTTSNVVTEAELPDLLAEGGTITVTCAITPKRQQGGIHGSWIVAIATPDGDTRGIVVTREPLQARVLETVSRTVAFLMDLGVQTVSIPTMEGDTVVNHIPDRPV